MCFKRLEPIFQTLAPSKDQGLSHVGPAGAGHFVKMVHNGVEYGLMQAYAEGFEIMEAKKEFDLDLGQIAEGWRYGSVVRSWLLDLAAAALVEDPKTREFGSLRRRFGRRPLDGSGIYRPGGARSRHHCVGAGTFPLPPRRAFRGQDARCPAEPVRRPRGEEDGVMAGESTTIVIFGATGDLTRRKLIRRCSNWLAKDACPINCAS